MKRDDKLFSIGEIAKALGVTRRIILHYEERGLIEPDKRDDATNNRYYTIDTFTKLRSIRSLQNLGLTLDEIRDYYNDSTDLMPLIRRMEEMRDQLNLNIEKLYERAKVSSAQVKAPQHSSGGHAGPRYGYHPADVLHPIPYRPPGRGVLLRGRSPGQ